MIWTPIENRSEEQKRLLWLGTQAERQRYIYWARVKIGNALRTQTKLAADAIEKTVYSGELSDNVSQAIDKSKPVITAVYHRLYMMIAPVFASKVLASIKATPAQESQWHRLVNEYLTSPETDSKIVGINDVTKRRIMSVIDENQGKSLIEIANAIRTNVMLEQLTVARSMVIAHTETVTASNWGSLMGAKTSGANVRKQWISTRDNVTRGLKPTDEFDHFHMDSKEAELDGMFDVPMRPSGVEQLQFPGDPTGSAGNIINCLLPGAVMEGDFNAALKSVYSGPAVEIITRGGRRLSVTLNHPIMTARGLVPSGELSEGDELVCKQRQVGMDSFIGPGRENNQNTPAAVEEIFKSFSLAHSIRVVMVRAFDLHGDAIFGDGDVEVVVPDGELLFNFNPERSQDSGEFAFQFADASEPFIHGFRSPDSTLHRVLAAASSIPSSRALSSDSRSISPKARPFKSFRLGLSPEDDAALDELSHQRDTHDAALLREFVHRHSGAIEFDEVVEVRYFKYSGHVYDLQSVYGLNIANGIVISNCRCTIGYLRKG